VLNWFGGLCLGFSAAAFAGSLISHNYGPAPRITVRFFACATAAAIAIQFLLIFLPQHPRTSSAAPVLERDYQATRASQRGTP